MRKLITLFKIVSEVTGIERKDMRRKSRVQERCDARFIFCDIARERIKMRVAGKRQHAVTYQCLADFLGGRDHTTIMHACNQAKDLIETDSKFISLYKKVEYLFMQSMGVTIEL